MTHRERFVRTLTGQEVDRVPFIKLFGGTNAHRPEWNNEYPGIGKCIDEVLRFEGPYRGWQITPVNMDLSNRGKPVVSQRADGLMVYTWEDGTAQIHAPGQDFHSQMIEWPVKDRESWRRIRDRELSLEDPTRFPANWSTYVAEFRNRDYPLQLTHRGVYGFARNLMGDEALAYMFYDDPELVHEIMDYYTDFALRLFSRQCAEIEFDLVELGGHGVEKRLAGLAGHFPRVHEAAV